MTTFDLDRQSLQVLDLIVSKTTAADLGRPTPCEGWTLADLLQHQVSENRGFAEAARNGAAEDWHGGELGDDAYAAYAASVTDFLSAYSEEGVGGRQIAISTFGAFPGEIVMAMHLVDSVAHGWDLAKTLGVPYEPMPEAVHAALQFAVNIPTDPQERIERGTFAPVVPVADDASELDQFLALLGRDPGWQAG